jgi:hypothetical protein
MTVEFDENKGCLVPMCRLMKRKSGQCVLISRLFFYIMKVSNIYHAFLSILFFASFVEAAKKLNALILYADDLGFGDLTCYNAESKIPTPHLLDRFAAAGIRFTDGHSSSGICTPSRYALLTGRHHWRDFHGIVGAMGKSVIKPERLTLPEMLKIKGYHTAAIGKWHLGWDWLLVAAKSGYVSKRSTDWDKNMGMRWTTNNPWSYIISKSILVSVTTSRFNILRRSMN